MTTQEIKAIQAIDFSQSLVALETTQKLCQALMKTPHYSKMGPEGIFAIVAKARSLNVDPLDALNGGLYCIQGKVEMSAQMMNYLIRQAGHSVTKDQKSDDTICILHGKRADTGDTWTESFSIAEAKRAGIFNERSPWGKYPRDMLFARSLSRLARQLFPDVIKGCYVEGEISQALEVQNMPAQQVVEQPKEEFISAEEAKDLEEAFDLVPEYKAQVFKFLAASFKVNSLNELPVKLLDRIKTGLQKKLSELTPQVVEELQPEQELAEVS